MTFDEEPWDEKKPGMKEGVESVLPEEGMDKIKGSKAEMKLPCLRKS